MHNNLSPVSIFEDCTQTIEHFRHQLESAQQYGLLFHWSSLTHEYQNALHRIRRYLQTSSWHAVTYPEAYVRDLTRIEEITGSKPFDAATGIRSRELLALPLLIETLSCTCAYLLQDMTKGEILRIAGSTDREKVAYFRRKCEEEEIAADRLLRTLSEDYRKNVQLTKDDLSAKLIALRYSKDKTLNKFEQATHEQIKNAVAAKIDYYWQVHLDELPEREDALAYQTAVVERWIDKVAVLDCVLRDICKQEETLVNDQSRGYDTQFPTAEPAVGQQMSTHSCQDEGHSAISHTTGSPPYADEGSMAKTSLTEVYEAFSEISINRSTTAASSRIIVSMPMIGPSQNGQTQHNIIDPARHSLQGPAPKLVETTSSNRPPKGHLPAPSHSSEDSFTFISRRPHPHEHEHNKESIAIVSLPLSNTKKKERIWNTAFAGLDQYAKGIFAKSSPDSESQRRLR